jgi:hypothetical protein
MMQLGDEWQHPIFGPVVVRSLTPRQDGRLRVTSISRDGKSAAHTVIKPGEELGPILRRAVPTEREIIEALVSELEDREWRHVSDERVTAFLECESCGVESDTRAPFTEHEPTCSWKKAMDAARTYLDGVSTD